MKEPSVKLDDLIKKPSLAQYVLKRKHLHDKDTIETAQLLIAEEEPIGMAHWYC